VHPPFTNQSLAHDVLANQGLPVGRPPVIVHMPLTIHGLVAPVRTNQMTAVANATRIALAVGQSEPDS